MLVLGLKTGLEWTRLFDGIFFSVLRHFTRVKEAGVGRT